MPWCELMRTLAFRRGWVGTRTWLSGTQNNLKILPVIFLRMRLFVCVSGGNKANYILSIDHTTLWCIEVNETLKNICVQFNCPIVFSFRVCPVSLEEVRSCLLNACMMSCTMKVHTSNWMACLRGGHISCVSTRQNLCDNHFWLKGWKQSILSLWREEPDSGIFVNTKHSITWHWINGWMNKWMDGWMKTLVFS